MADSVLTPRDRERIAAAVRSSLDADVVAIESVSGHLSLRRFARVRLRGAAPSSAIARIQAPEDPAGRPEGIPPEPPLEPIRACLESAGLPVPRRLGGGEGLDLLEDLGERSLRDVAATAAPGALRALYLEACALVPRLQRVANPGGVAAFDRRLDAPYFRYKADLFAAWSLPERGADASPAERDAVRAAFAIVAEEAARAPHRLAHRDFQSANLHVREGGAADARLVMLDLQGAFLAPPEYDLVCLLHDSYVELPDALVDELAGSTRPALPDAPDAESFARRFDLLTVTRKGKDHARYLYASRTRGDHRFLPFVDRAVRSLRSAAERSAARDPRFGPLSELIADLPESACAR